MSKMRWNFPFFFVVSVLCGVCHAMTRPSFTVPSLLQIRDILSELEAPIISALTERANLATNPALYINNGRPLLESIKSRESLAVISGRFDYGKLEYPFTLPLIAPDHATNTNPFPPGRFHQDSFTGNQDLVAFYINTLVPLFNSSTSVFFHLDGSTRNDDAALNLDATLLALISHRVHIGKIVAESKYAANATGLTPLINLQDSVSIRTSLTNTTQEASVLSQASTAASAFSSGWSASGALLPSNFSDDLQNATAVLFRELIDVTTEIEVQYLLERFV